MSTRIITSSSSRIFPDFKEIFRYKDLFFTLAWRDFRVRYAQTSIGLLWALIQPLATIAILSLVFGNFIGLNTGVPHLIYTVAGMSVWTYFSFVMSNSGSAIITNQEMIKKIYFPRLIIPLSKAVVGLIDLGITLFILIILFFVYGITPSVNAWMSIFFILLAILEALSVGIWLSALTVRYRDFQHVVPFLVQIGLYITPVAYPAEFATQHLPKWAASIYYLNPMAGVVQGFRWSLFGGTPPDGYFWISFAMVIVLFITSLMYFKKVEDQMADFV